MDTQENVDVDWDKMILTDNEGREHEMCRHEYWYLAPTRTNWSPEDQSVHPLHFGLLLHNARRGQGIVLAMEDLMQGISPASMKTGDPKQAEEMFEKVRAISFPHRGTLVPDHLADQAHQDRCEGRATRSHRHIPACSGRHPQAPARRDPAPD